MSKQSKVITTFRTNDKLAEYIKLFSDSTGLSLNNSIEVMIQAFMEQRPDPTAVEVVTTVKGKL